MGIAVLFAVAFAVFLTAAILYGRARVMPPMAVSIGLAILTLAIGLTLPPMPPEPPEPPVTTDFGGIRPHLQGEGSTTPGGRGGLLCRITSLSSGGGVWNDGTVKGCLVATPPGCMPRTGTQSACARTVISDVSGAIDFGNQTLIISGPYLSAWFSTAPSCDEGSGPQGCEAGAGGLTLQRVNLRVDTHDTYLNHLRIRRSSPFISPLLMCEFTAGHDCSPVHHNVADHLSVSWADMRNDGSGLSGVNNVNGAQPSNSAQVMVDSLFSEPLWDPDWGGINVAFCGTFARNLLAHGFDRNPIWSGGRCLFYNNVVFNGSEDLAGQALISATTYYAPDRTGRIDTVLRDNVYLTGPNSGAVNWTLGLYVEAAPLAYGGGASVHLRGNTGPGITGPEGDGQWTAVHPKQYDVRPNAATGGPTSNVRVDTAPAWFTDAAFRVIANSGMAVRDAVLANAGARPRDRDAADERVIDDVLQGDGTSYLDWATVESRYGGQPVIVERTRVCQVPENPNGPGTRVLADGSRNTRIEDWLESDPACGARRLEARP